MHPSALLMSPRLYPTRLPQYVAALYGCMIVYASLEPFGAWMAPLPDTPFFLFAPWPRFTRSDLVINVLAYVPFGFFVALIGIDRRPSARFATAVGVGVLLSFSVESMQMDIPTRGASIVDLMSNAAGAAGGGALPPRLWVCSSLPGAVEGGG